MARLFISHSSRNNDKAIEVRDWLAKNGWTDVFLDLDPERGIVPASAGEKPCSRPPHVARSCWHWFRRSGWRPAPTLPASRALASFL
jgi:hypothetical protein